MNMISAGEILEVKIEHPFKRTAVIVNALAKCEDLSG